MRGDAAVALDVQTDVPADIPAELHRLRAARLRVAEAHPFWGHLVLHVRLVPAPHLPAIAATDCLRHIWFNPTYTRHLSIAQLAFVLCHEVGHQLFETNPRRGDRDPTLWNCATDYAINRIVHAAALTERADDRMRSPNGVYPDVGAVEILSDADFNGLTAEAIYERLLAEQPRHLPREGGVVLRFQLPAPTADGDEGIGSGARNLDVSVTDHHGGGLDIHLPADLDVNLDVDQQSELAERISAAVAAYHRAERDDVDPGHLPQAALRQLHAARRSVVPWQRVLHRYAGACLGRVEYSRSRPNRRFLLDDVVVPGLVHEGPSRLVVAVDTSGSMDDDTLTTAFAELAALATLVPEVTVLVADATIQAVVPCHALPQFIKNRQLLGGGGTDHRPVFAWLAQQSQPPELFIGLTDLHSRFPARPPGFPVLWLVPPDHGAAPWGAVSVVSSRQK